MEQLFKKTKLLSLLILAISFQGCEDDDEVLPQVIADFTYTLNEDSGTIRFINTSEGASSYKWDFDNGETSSEINPVRTFENGTYTVVLEASNVAGAAATFTDEITVQVDNQTPEPGFDAGLLTNGDFETGDDPWIGGGRNIVTEGGNSFNSVDVTVAGNPFDVNLSQMVELTQGTNYILTFDASASVARTILAGIGLNEAPFTSTAPSVNLTTDTQTFTLQLAANDFGGANSRVLFDMGAEVGTVVIDNVSLVEGGDGSDTNGGGTLDQGEISEACAGSLIQDYEMADNSIFSDFGGGTALIIDNPNTAVNTSAKVGQMQKFNDQPFGGTTMSLGGAVDFSNGEIFTMDVYSQRAAALTFKLEGLNIEKVISTAGTGWETMTFDFTGETGAVDVSAITLIFDNGTNGDAAGDPDAWTFLFDNLRLCDGGGGTSDQGEISEACAGSLIQDYETADNSIFGDFGGGTALIIDNPNTAVNTSAKVGQMQKFNDQPFGGTTMSLGGAVDFSNGEIFTMDVYSQRAAALTFKLEGLNIEKVISTAGTGWETMTFDFTGETGAVDVSAITLIFDNGTNGDAAGDPDAWTFLFDNLRLCDGGGSGGGDCPAPPVGDLISNGNFEAGVGCWQLLQNGGTVTLSTTESNGGGTNSAQIQTGPGVNPGIKQERAGVGVYLPNTQYTVTFDIKASTPLATGAVFKAFTFSEGGDGSSTPATQHILEGGLATVSNTWETKTYTFTSAANADQVAGGISFLAELVCGPAGCEGVINIDNVSIVPNP